MVMSFRPCTFKLGETLHFQGCVDHDDLMLSNFTTNKQIWDGLIKHIKRFLVYMSECVDERPITLLLFFEEYI